MPSEIRTRQEGQDLLAQRIKDANMTTKKFAKNVLKRDARIVMRWLDGTQAIPDVVMDFLLNPEPAEWPQCDDY